MLSKQMSSDPPPHTRNDGFPAIEWIQLGQVVFLQMTTQTDLDPEICIGLDKICKKWMG